MNNSNNRAIIIVAIIGAIATITAAFLSYRAGVDQVMIPITTTQTAVAKQTPTIDSVSIQEMPFSAIPYTFGNDAATASSSLFIHNGESGMDYQLKYSVPQTGDAYAGLYFSFDDSENLENFKFVEVTVSFEDDNTSFDMFMKDITKPWNVTTIRIGKTANYPNDVKVTQTDDDYKITIPLSMFTPLDLKAVKEVGFSVSTLSSGVGSFTVKKLEFIKE
jgi:hypothetical protein